MEKYFKLDSMKYFYTKEYQNYINNNFNIDASIINYVIDGLYNYDTIEEQICHIYIKLCKLFKYDCIKLLYGYDTLFDKERLEKVSINNPYVLCGEFAKIFCKLISDIYSLDVRCIKRGLAKTDHEFCQIICKNQKLYFESTLLDSDGFNDLGLAKFSDYIDGITYEDQLFRSKLENVCKKLLLNYSLPNKILYANIKDSFEERFEYFMNQIKYKNINNNELITLFLYLKRFGYFSLIEYEYCIYNNLYKVILIKYKDQFYLFNTYDIDYNIYSYDEIYNLFKSNKLIHIDSKNNFVSTGKVKRRNV